MILTPVRTIPILCALAWAGIALADTASVPPEVAILKDAGFHVDPSKGGGYNVEPKSAADLTEERWKQLEALGQIKRFACGGKEFDDAALARLVKLRSIESIFLNGPSVTDAGLASLLQLPRLQSFGVHHSTVLEGPGIASLKDAPSLTSIEFGGCTIDDEGAYAIATLKRLKEVRLGHCRNTRASFPALAALPQLERIEVTSNWDPWCYDIEDLAAFSECPHLHEVEIHDMLLPYHGGTEAFKRFKGLKTLKLYWCYASPEDLAQLRSALPAAKIDYDHEAPPERVIEARKRMDEYLAKKTGASAVRP